MENNNDLTGLTGFGFQNTDKKFDEKIFADNKTVNLLKPIIEKYFKPTQSVYKGSSSYGLKHVAERHLNNYVANGELIYAMHLAGYKIIRDDPNCFFNINRIDLKYFSNAKNVLDKLQEPIKREIVDYLRFNQSFLKYKYHFNFFIHNKFSNNNSIKRNDIINIISKEINENPKIINHWFNLLKEIETIIPDDKLHLLSKLFNVSEDNLKNEIPKFEKSKSRSNNYKINKQEINDLLIEIKKFVIEKFEFRRNRFMSSLYLPYVEYRDKQNGNNRPSLFQDWNTYDWSNFKSNIHWQIIEIYDISEKMMNNILNKCRIILETITENAKDFYPAENYMKLAEIPVMIIKGIPLRIEKRKKANLKIGDICYVAWKTKSERNNEYFVQGAIIEKIDNEIYTIFSIDKMTDELNFKWNGLFADEIGETPEQAVLNRF